jgi:L-alanine-DL-glutamate epimerase-like enolase superfamily enzyme
MQLTAEIDRWPLKRPFRIAYHTFTQRDLLRVELHKDGLTGRGEAGGHPQLEPIETALQRVLGMRDDIAAGLSREDLLTRMPIGPARNALDCAMWDLEAKQAGRRVWDLADLPEPEPILTAYTIGVAATNEMVEEAKRMRDYSLLKLKVDGESGFELLQAVVAARPGASYIIDANEAWRPDQLEQFIADAVDLGVKVIEQPLPKGDDDALATIESPIPIAADESFHGLSDLDRMAGHYDVINIKLDKIGGLTEGLLAARAAREKGLQVMVGCNGGTSLGIAPAYCLGLLCDFVDLDSPLLLAHDREPGLEYQNGRVSPPAASVWG